MSRMDVKGAGSALAAALGNAVAGGGSTVAQGEAGYVDWGEPVSPGSAMIYGAMTVWAINKTVTEQDKKVFFEQSRATSTALLVMRMGALHVLIRKRVKHGICFQRILVTTKRLG